MTFEVAITIVLTALCAMLAVLAIGIGALAVWGYAGIKEVRDSIASEAAKRVDAALDAKLKEYPDADDILRRFKRIEEQASLMEQLRNQLSDSEPKTVVQASNQVEDVSRDEEVGSIAEDYPTAERRIDGNE